MDTRQKMAGWSFRDVLFPHIPQLRHMHAIAQAALRYLLSWRIGILHTASHSPSLAFEWLCPSTGTSYIRVPWIQDQLPSLWGKIKSLSALHSTIGAAPLKPSQTITIDHNSHFREQKGSCVFPSVDTQFVSGIPAASLPGQEWRGSRKPIIEGGWVSSGFWLYKRMINDNSNRNKTKHLSCCQSNETNKHQDMGTGQCGHFPEKHTTIKLLLLWINRPIHLPWVPAEKGRGERGNNFSSVS